MKRTRFVAIDRRLRSAVWGGALVALLLQLEQGGPR